MHLCSHAGQKYFISGLNLYLLIDVLFLEAQQVDINAAMLLQGHQLRKIRGSYRLLNCKLFELWDQYNNGILSSEELLNGCALLYKKHNKFNTRSNADDMRDDLEEAGEDASDDEGVAEVEVVEAGEVIDNFETSQSSEG